MLDLSQEALARRAGISTVFVGRVESTRNQPTINSMQKRAKGLEARLPDLIREAEALEIANSTAYGLTGYLWTNDLTRALRFSDALEAGMIWVNSENVRHLPTPFGGVKASGIGRDGGDWSFEFYMETKNTAFAIGNHKIQRLGA